MIRKPIVSVLLLAFVFAGCAEIDPQLNELNEAPAPDFDTNVAPAGPQPGGCPSITSMTADVSGLNANMWGAYDLSVPCDWYISDHGGLGTNFVWRVTGESPGNVVPSASLCAASTMTSRVYGKLPDYYTVENEQVVWHDGPWEMISPERVETGTWNRSTSKCSFPRFQQGCGAGVSSSCSIGFSGGSPYAKLRFAMKARIYATFGAIAGKTRAQHYSN